MSTLKQDAVRYQDAKLQKFDWEVSYWSDSGEVESICITDASGIPLDMTEIIKDSVVNYIEQQIIEQRKWRWEHG